MSPPLRIPLETIERILHFAFDSDVPPATPFTCLPPAPPRSTSHILLVSKGIRALALPLHWRSVTVLTAHDYVHLWAPETGLFAGQTGQQRASWVREIRINTAATGQLPFDLPRVEQSYANRIEPGEVLVQLTAVKIPRLKHVCFFEHGTEVVIHTKKDYEVEAAERAAGRFLAGDEELKTMVGTYEEEEKERERERYLSTLPDDEREEEEERDRERAEPDGDPEWEDEYSEILAEVRRKAFHRLVLNAAPNLESVRMATASDVAPALVVPLEPSVPFTFHDPISFCFAPHSQHHNIPPDTRRDLRCDFIGVPIAKRSSVAKEAIQSRSSPPTLGFWRWANEDGTFSPFE